MNNYGQLTILDEVKHQGRWKYKVQCSCGKIEMTRKDWVVSGRTTSCKSCASKRTAKKYPPPINSKCIGDFSGTHYNHIKHSALRRKIEFNVSAEYLYNLWLQQDCICALTGIPIYLSTSLSGGNPDWKVITASLDRIDNSKGYVEGNVWWVHKTINRLKNNYSLEELLFWSKLLLDKHGNPDPSVVNAITVTTKEQRLESEEATNNLSTSAQQPEDLYWIEQGKRHTKALKASIKAHYTKLFG